MSREKVTRDLGGTWAFRDFYGNEHLAPSWNDLRCTIRDYIEALASTETDARSHALAALGELHYMIP